MQHIDDFNVRNPDERAQLKALLQNRERRALAAYWRLPQRDHPHTPDGVTHIVHRDTEMEYVDLHAENVGTLALYRVRRDGQLKRLTRYPDFRTGVRAYKLDELE